MKTDVTNDPSYGNFSSVVGTWKTKTPFTLTIIDKELRLSAHKVFYHQGDRDLATLPTGTEIRIEHLILDNTTEAGPFVYAVGSLTSGPYAGQNMRLDWKLFAPNVFQHPYVDTTTRPVPSGKDWAIAPDVLEK